ncbi:uncharacterized protein I303_103210 [Kwoniella dejecticola CBS 10117]|uniref:Methyltransferase domain-containing protein n=1 Tax=Kwoniella dejecticola CBS 10117 TaxID=1296121 RepID=A0A1A6AAY3_9TREE|nr:uncharacterized protein I303_03234 [Kwoniella dejecticola CBS 10117]OBR87210.1 hypothetical protein I303_03234 [Kwoniella dejecticola CBS 10117]
MSYSSNLTNHNPSKYQTNASFVYSAANSSPVLDLLDAQPGEKIIDLGCGTGQLTIQLQGIVCVGEGGEVVGVDSNESMLESARQSLKQASSHRIKFIQADIQNFPSFASKHPELEGHFDKVFTSATLHWCKSNPGGVVELVKWLLKPGGKFAFEFGGFGNVVGIRAALHQSLKSRGMNPIPLDPWYFPTDKQYQKLLDSKGFTTDAECIKLVPRPTPLPTNLKGWLETFARNSFLSTLSDEDAQSVLDEVVQICRVDNYWSDAHPGSGINPRSDSESNDKDKDKDKGDMREGWEVMYVRLRGIAIKPQ